MNSKDSLYVDLTSDLHIDQWDNSIQNKYHCGIVKNYPFEWKKKVKSKILIIAGDISDDLDKSLSYLNEISVYYDKILFVDGNHEHVNEYPNLYSINEINEKVKALNNKKLIYLPKNDYIVDNTVFIGYCGWWNYRNEDETDIKNNMNYFKEWIPHFTQKEVLQFSNNVILKATEEATLLKEKIKKYESDSNINKIVIVSHSPPHTDKCHTLEIGTEHNTLFKDILMNKNYYKISHWFSGHLHSNYDGLINNIKLNNNPRGRPEDYDRKNYFIEQIKI